MKKRCFFVLSFLAISLLAFSQDIGIAYSKEEGEILIKQTESFWYGNEFATGLSYGKNISSGKEVWELRVAVKAITSEIGGDGRYSFDKGAKMYLMTESNKVIEAIQQVESGAIDHSSERHFNFDNSTEWTFRPVYLICSDDILTLSKEKITKIRLETTKGMKDISFKIPMDLICKEYNVLMESIDFNKGF